MQKYLYNYYTLSAKAAYHLRMEEILTSELENEKDPMLRKRLVARRCHHRRLFRKYHAMANQAWGED